MKLMLHNSMSGKKEVFEPLNPDAVSLYVCGPTVYGSAHIGNARPAVVFDVLARLLRHLYPKLIYVRNITDVDDKINAAAKKEKVSIGVITKRFTEKYHQDMNHLGVLPPDIEPFATKHIAEMIELIQKLVEKGNAYEAESHVLFDVNSYPQYGSLSGRKIEDMIAGARVEIAPYKKNPADFVLWKPSEKDEPGWESPFGRGRPGWHIECSAMVKKHLGDSIDIHGGGQDLLFPHHENECAQSYSAHGKPLARFWVHNGYLKMGEDKMSKSLGNIRLVSDIIEEVPGEAARLLLLQAQYRQPLEWSGAALQQALRSLDHLYSDLQSGASEPDNSPPDSVLHALFDDLNTPKAIAALFALAKEKNYGAVLAGGKMLGILQKQPSEWFAERAKGIDEKAIEDLLAEREAARAEKDFARADALRGQIEAMGVIIEDGADGAKWRKA
ncbi:MAG: cysteine--tRNA ligase [Parvibaculales bacterium]